MDESRGATASNRHRGRIDRLCVRREKHEDKKESFQICETVNERPIVSCVLTK